MLFAVPVAVIVLATFPAAASEPGQPLDCSDWVFSEPGFSCSPVVARGRYALTQFRMKGEAVNRRAVLFSIALSLPALAAEPANEPSRDPATGKFTYQEVVTVEGVPAAELYSRARAWGAKAYRSMKEVEQLDDKDAGRTILKGNFETTYFMNPAWVNHTLTIEVKDGRFRYEMRDFVFVVGATRHEPLEGKNAARPGRKTILKRTAIFAEEMIGSLKAAMAKPAEKW